MNDYCNVNLSKCFLHAHLKYLHLNDNKIECWDELTKLSVAFPSLQKLIVSNNPIHCIPPSLDSSTFPQLLILNFNNTALCSWDSIECLSVLCKLQELSLLKIPLGKQMDEKMRRKAFIARLPNIKKLNKSVVTESEREMSERWLIREMKDVPDPPVVYHHLIKKHGELKPLADINLNPVDRVIMEFHFDGLDRKMERREVNLDQTVFELKKWVSATLVGKPVNRFLLNFRDKTLTDWAGEELKNNQKMLYNYRMNDGDEIHVWMK